MLVLVLGAVAVSSMHLLRQRLLEAQRRGFEAHVASVVRLVREGARQAAAATDLVYSLSEQRLVETIQLLVRRPSARVDPEHPERRGVIVWLSGQEPESFSGDWGPVSAGERTALARQVLAAEPGELVESGTVSRHGLYCAHLPIEGTTRICCRMLEELRQLRRETGIGHLLKEVEGQGVAYAALQDEAGVLAASPGAQGLSVWERDAFLEQGRDEGQTRPVFRRLGSADRALFEGVGAFALPDGTTAALRVGVDASMLAETEADLETQFRWLVGVVALLVLIAVAGAAIVSRLEQDRALAERRLTAREEESRHWRAIGQMAATVAHEVRNPLNTVQMAAQRLRREFTLPVGERAEFEELTGVMRSEAARVERVVTEFLELGRPLRLEPVTVPAEGAVAEAVAPLRMRAEQEGKQLKSADCCSSRCEADLDGVKRCQSGEGCLGDGEKCVDTGTGGLRCASLTACRPSGEICSEDADCCTSNCNRLGLCGPDDTACVELGLPCTEPADCCSGFSNPTSGICYVPY